MSNNNYLRYIVQYSERVVLTSLVGTTGVIGILTLGLMLSSAMETIRYIPSSYFLPSIYNA